MTGRTAYPTRRDPATGYVAQRILLISPHWPPVQAGRGALPPWLLTTLDDLGRIQIRALTDDEVAGWPTLYDELTDDGTGGGDGVLASLPLGPGADDAELWIPPASDAMLHRPDERCPHCGSERWHVRTGRCGSCGRRPGVPAMPPEVLPIERAALVATMHAPRGDGCVCGQALDRPHAEHVADMIDTDEQRATPS